jgi:proton-dependent oligopeptide transporter, POT family
MAAAPSPDQVKPDPFLKQLTSFSGIYWIANWMELVERFAYYGVRVVLPVFMVAAFEQGGPEFDHDQKGFIYAIWALVQSFVPLFTGGFADRYGYKINIAISTVIKILGYLVMGYSILLAEKLCGMPLKDARPLGLDHTYEIFFVGAILLALGTAIFKPGLQGLIAHQIPKKNAAVGWAVFYQMVNVGGFIGPLLAGYLRILDWNYVFLACAIGIALNFIPLILFHEPEHHGEAQKQGPLTLLWEAIKGLLEPRLFFFTICFAGFWLMFYQLFDILPNFIDDWVDSRGVAGFLGGIFGAGAIPTINEGNLTQEWIINFNALLISLFAFAMGYITGKVKALRAIIVGIGISAIAIYMLGMSMNGWWILLAVGIFSLGEMTASPTKMRYLASIAPPGKEGLYMGYVNFTVGIGWSVGSILAGKLYQSGGDKIVLARRYLSDPEFGNIPTETVAAISKNDLLPYFYKTMETDAWGARDLLWNTYTPYDMWWIFMAIGIVSMVGIWLYNHFISAADKNPNHAFNLKGHRFVQIALVPIALAFWVFWAKNFHDESAKALIVQAILFSGLFLASFLYKPEPYVPAGAQSGAGNDAAED